MGRLRTAFVLAAAMAAAPAFAQTDVFGPANARLGLSEAQLRSLYRHALFINDGQVYTVDFITRPTCEEMAPFTEPRNTRRPLSAQLRGEAQRQIRRFPSRALIGFPPELREQIRSLVPRQHTPPFRLADGTCMLAELLELKPLPMPAYERIRHQLSYMVEQGWLPHPDKMLADPALAQRRLADSILTAEELAAAPADLDVNQRLSNGGTMLVRALGLGRYDLARALLARKANPNLCAPRFCGIETVLYGADQAAGERMLADLLAAGADPNQTGEGRNIYLPLTVAAGRNNLAAARALLAAGAKIDGAPGRVPPLAVAAGTNKREAFEFLLANGADIWVRDETAPFYGTVYAAATQTGDESLIREVERRMLADAERTGRFKWQGWVEQGGKRIPLASGDIRLKREPFRMIFRVDGDVGVLVASADSDVLQKATREGNLDTVAVRVGTIGAEALKGGDELFVNTLAGNADPLNIGVHQRWYWESEDVRRFTRRTPVAGGYEYVREVRGVLLESASRTLKDYAGRAIHLVVAAPISLAIDAQRLQDPAYVTLRFDD
jgi:hypothetical protein